MSTTATHVTSPVTTRTAEGSDHRWWTLGVIGMAQLMVVLDATIVNIALPRAQQSLGFSNDNRQWIVTAYALAFGALLLIGGRLGDLFGRKTTFLIGLAGFATASAVGGASTGFTMLVIARAGQGVFGALLAPAALSLLSTTFTEPAERAKAFAIFGAIAGGGGAIGLILGGALTEWLSWRWCLYVNLAIAVPAFLAGVKLLRGGRPAGRQHLDLPGAAAVSSALFALVYGFAHAESSGWGSTTTLVFLMLGVVLLAVFVGIERVVAHPLLPLRVLLNRDRGSSFISILFTGAGMFAVFLFLTFYLQVTLGFSPIKTGLGFLPMIAALGGSAQVAARLLPKVGPRPLVPVGMVLAALGMASFTQLGLHTSYASHVLPGLIVTGLGFGLVFAPSIQGGTSGVMAEDAGVASATVNTMQQVGGSIGTAVFSTIAASATSSYLSGHHAPGAPLEAALHGYLSVYSWATGLFLLGAVLSALLWRSGPLAASTGDPVLVH